MSQQDLASAVIGDHDPAHVVNLAELVDLADHVVHIEVVQAAAGLVEVLLPQDVGHLRDREAQLGHSPLVDLDTDLFFAAADHFHSGDAFDRLEAFRELPVRNVAQPC